VSTGHKITKATWDFIHSHCRKYLESGGIEGHILDLRNNNAYALGTHLLLRYKGRKSGKTYITPLSYGIIGGEVVVVASKGGADANPTWYVNLTASPVVEFQIATQAFRGTWREPEGDEYQQVWDFMVKCFPFYATYQERTSRKIPVLMLQLVEPIPVFKPSDISEG
jgi:deazaflavin-dependent oxidoreductase (nitroreductase family)